jgi:hypothetical protein
MRRRACRWCSQPIPIGWFRWDGRNRRGERSLNSTYPAAAGLGSEIVPSRRSSDVKKGETAALAAWLSRQLPTAVRGTGPQGALRNEESSAGYRAIQRLVIWNHDLTEWFVTPQDDMAPDLAYDTEADPLDGSHAGTSGDDRKVAHTVTRRASKCSSGTGRLSASRAST